MRDGLIHRGMIERLTAFDTIWVGFSGGLDSTVLLHALKSIPFLAEKLRAVHVNHGLSPHAAVWALQCEDCCKQWSVPLTVCSVEIKSRSNLEATARKHRLHAFKELITAADCVVVAHHQRDQAETVLLRLCRGSGVDGLAAMRAERSLGPGVLMRPLLHQTPDALQAYAKRHQLTWIDDESNADVTFARNDLRHRVLPILEKRWPRVMSNISECAQHCQQTRDNLADLAALDYPSFQKDGPLLRLQQVRHLPKARLSNVLRAWINHCGFLMPTTAVLRCLVDDVIFADASQSPYLLWSGVAVRRYRDMLHISKHALDELAMPQPFHWSDFPQPHRINDTQQWVAKPSQSGLHVPLGAQLEVRYRVGGESIVWRGHRRSLKKLWQAAGVAPWLRDKMPFIYLNGQLAAVLDFCVSDLYYRDHGDSVYTLSKIGVHDDNNSMG